MLAVLRQNRDFRRLWLAQLISQTGDWLSRTAILGLIERLHGSGAATGVAALYAIELATRLLPNSLLYPLAGSAADRLPRRFLMVAADVLRVFVLLAVLAVDQPRELPLLYALIVLQVALGTFFSAAQSAAIAGSVASGQRHDAFALSAATWSFTLAFGAALGGVLVHAFGTRGTILLDAASYLVSACLLFGLRLAPVPVQPEPFRLRDVLLLGDLRRGLDHARRHGTLVVLATKTFWGGAGGFLVALSVLSVERFSARDASGAPLAESVGLVVGLFYAARGLGTGLGPVLVRAGAGSSERSLRRQISGGFLVGALGYALVPLTRSLPLALAFVAVAHAGGSTLWVASTTFWQGRVDDAFRGRVFALEFLGMTLAFAFGGFVAAAVFDASSRVDWMLWSSAALVLVGGGIWSVLSSRELRARLASTAPAALPLSPTSPTAPDAIPRRPA